MKKAFPLLKCSGSEVTHVISTHILWVSTYHMVYHLDQVGKTLGKSVPGQFPCKSKHLFWKITSHLCPPEEAGRIPEARPWGRELGLRAFLFVFTWEPDPFSPLLAS